MTSADHMMMLIYVGTTVTLCGRDDGATLVGLFIAAVGLIGLWGIKRSERISR